MTNTDAYEEEREILREFCEAISVVSPVDNSISNSKLVRQTKNKLKVALQDVDFRCTCIRRSWGGPCELCQESDRELVDLRRFYNVIRTADKRGYDAKFLQDLIGGIKERFSSKSK